VFHATAEPQLCIIVKFKGAYETLYGEGSGTDAQKLDRYSTNIRYYESIEGEFCHYYYLFFLYQFYLLSGPKIQWTRQGIYLPFPEFNQLRHRLEKAKEITDKFIEEGSVEPPSVWADRTDGVVSTVAFNKHNQPELYVNRDYYSHPYTIQSIKIGGDTFDSFFELMLSVAAFVYKKAGVDFPPEG